PEDYLRGEPASGFSKLESVIVNTQVVRHYYDNVIQIKRALYPWVKQKVIFGTSPLRQFWCKKTNEMFYKKRVLYEDKQGIVRFKAVTTKEEVVIYNAPVHRADDIFNTVVYPHNGLTPDDIEVVFFRALVKNADLEKKAKMG